MNSEWTPERIAGDRRIASSQKWRAALAEIERLQAMVAELEGKCPICDGNAGFVSSFDGGSEWDDCMVCGGTGKRDDRYRELVDRDQRREQLLREFAEVCSLLKANREIPMPVSGLDALAARILAELRYCQIIRAGGNEGESVMDAARRAESASDA